MISHDLFLSPYSSEIFCDTEYYVPFHKLKKNLIDSSLLNEYVTFVSILPSILGKELVSVCSTHTNFCLICKKVNLTSFLLKYQ